MVLDCSPGPTALDVLSGQGHFLQVLSHLSASERVSLASYKTNAVVIKSLGGGKIIAAEEKEDETKYV